MHEQARAFFASQLADLPPLRVVEFGSCNMNGSVRDVYPQAASWHGIDLQPGPGVDEIADAASWQTNRWFDVCISSEAFEHTPRWRSLIATARRVLVPGGTLYASCATGYRPPHSAVDGGPLRNGEFYANVDPDDMTQALAGWVDVVVEVADGYYGGDDLYVRATRGD